MTAYPKAPRSDDADELHGITVPDPYRWLEREDTEATRAWSQAQDRLLESVAETWSARPHWERRIAELLRGGAIGAPVWRGDRCFVTRRLPDEELGVVLTIDPDGTERVLVDPMALDPSGTTTLDAWQPSKEGGLLAYQLSEGGTEESVLRIIDVVTGDEVDAPIDRARYSPVAWLPGGDAFYYVRRLPEDQVPDGEEQYHRRVWLHRLGTDAADDVEIFGAGLTATNYYGVSVSREGRWLVVSAAEGTAPRNDVWIADLAASPPAAPALRPVQVGLDAQSSLHVGRDGRLYVHTDLDAPRGRLCVTSPETPEPQNWVDLVPEDPEAVLEDFAILDDEALAAPILVTHRTIHAVSRVRTHALADGAVIRDVALPGLGTIGGLSERPDGGHECWFVYTDHTTPITVLRYDAAADDVSVWATTPGAVDVPTVSTTQEEFTSKDGTVVRMFVIAPDAAPDGPRPTILYGYGGFGVPLTPAFSAGILSWVEAGGVYAVANLRGGSEEGEDWHRAGMLGTKQNVFDDFHAAAEHLVTTGRTTAHVLGISGGSNGGLLVGAALTQRPDLYRAVVCSAPLLDMVRYERFGLGATWNVEYGSAADPEQLAWLLAYSPYHHVVEGVRYPATLFTVFAGDTRVDTLHARKMAAALQHATSASVDERPVLLRAEHDVGHGARSVGRAVSLAADTAAFMAHELGLTAPDPD
jgi:prolyl oligopeptidase